jgi:hypothetical protein
MRMRADPLQTVCAAAKAQAKRRQGAAVIIRLSHFSFVSVHVWRCCTGAFRMLRVPVLAGVSVLRSIVRFPSNRT